MKHGLNVVAIGGAHQYPHFLPVAFELHRREAMAVTIFANDAEAGEAVRRLSARLDADCPPIVEMRLPAPLEGLARRIASPMKVPRLLYWARQLRRCDALLSAERTSTILRRLPGRLPLFMHIPHGAGDRQAGFERRLALFDQVIVAGEKDRARMVAEGLVAPNACHVGGFVKFEAMGRIAGRPKLFANDRPCILYNPHFSEELTSFEAVADRFIEDVLRDGRYNLVVAPHVRLAEGWSEAKRAGWESRSVPDRIIVDLGSERSSDMTYTMAADIYVGDGSSQVYEFVITPRPCLFINTRARAWQGDPSFAMWRLGPLIGPDEDLLAAVDGARETHGQFLALQQEMAGAVYAPGDAIARVADLITEIVSGRGAPTPPSAR